MYLKQVLSTQSLLSKHKVSKRFPIMLFKDIVINDLNQPPILAPSIGKMKENYIILNTHQVVLSEILISNRPLKSFPLIVSHFALTQIFVHT